MMHAITSTLAEYSRITIAGFLLIFLVACGSKDTKDNKPEVAQLPAIDSERPATSGYAEEDILIDELFVEEFPVKDTPSAADLTIPGADIAHQMENQRFQQQETVTLQDVEATLYFGFDKSSLTAQAKSELAELVPLLERIPGNIHINGHADDRGTATYNMALSLRRAESVAGYLSREGIDQSRLQISGYGSDQPAMVGKNEQSWTKNRRVEIKLESISTQ